MAEEVELGEIVVVLSKMPPESFEDYRQRIKAAEKLGKFDECLKLCLEGLNVTPAEKELILMKAKFLVLTDQFDKAAEVLNTIPMNAETIFISGLIFYQRGNFNKSVKHFKRAWQLDPTMNHALMMKAKSIRLIRLEHESEKVFEKTFGQMFNIFIF